MAKPFVDVRRRLSIGSRVNREVHARFWERAEVKSPRATRPSRDSYEIGHADFQKRKHASTEPRQSPQVGQSSASS